MPGWWIVMPGVTLDLVFHWGGRSVPGMAVGWM